MKIKLRHNLTPTQWEHLCIHCGECCRLLTTDRQQVTDQFCPQLIRQPDGTARCGIYRHRLDYQIQPGGWCGDIEKADYRGPKCGYNKILGFSKIRS